MEFSLLGAAAIGLGLSWAVLWAEDGRTNPEGIRRGLLDLLIGAAAIGMLVGRVTAMIAGGTNPLAHPGDLLIVRGGVHTGAAATAALATLGLARRRGLPGSLDPLVPAVLAGLAGWHGGCIVGGTCLGTPTGLPWGIAQEGSEIARHPVGIYTALLLAAAALLLALWKARRPAPGIVAGMGLAAASAIRLVTEPLRPGIGAGPEWWYAAGIAAGAGTVVWALIRPTGRPDQP